MIKYLLTACMVTAIGCNVATSTSNEETSPQPSASSRTEWPDKLVGRWEGTVEGNRYVEEWQRGSCDGTYEGRSEMWQGEKMLGAETMRITRFGDHWIFMADPDGEHITAFQLEDQSEGSWTFANEEHDFPQRISYNLNGDNLNPWIEGPGEYGPMRMSFDLKRVK